MKWGEVIMSETIKTSEHYYTKNFGNYGSSDNNFVANQEITLTITLNEYRNLVEADAKTRNSIDKANSEKYKAQSENEKLKKEICELKDRLYDLQNGVKSNNTTDGD